MDGPSYKYGILYGFFPVLYVELNFICFVISVEYALRFFFSNSFSEKENFERSDNGV